MPKTCRITSGLVLEDNAETQAWLSELLKKVFHGIHVTCADTRQQALQLLQDKTFDIALIDLGLPDGSGIDVIQHIKNTDSQDRTYCVVSTIFDDTDHLFDALKAGANGYILKDQTGDDIEKLLLGILNDIPPLSPAIARKVLAFFQAVAPTDSALAAHTTSVRPKEKSNPLTEKETNILLLIAKGYTVAKTAELSGITYYTAASYVKTIYRKLNISSRAEATSEAINLGILNIVKPQ